MPAGNEDDTGGPAAAAAVIESSRQKLSDAARSFRPWMMFPAGPSSSKSSSSSSSSSHATLSAFPCASVEEATAYRCKCSFQIISTAATVAGAAGVVDQQQQRQHLRQERHDGDTTCSINPESSSAALEMTTSEAVAATVASPSSSVRYVYSYAIRRRRQSIQSILGDKQNPQQQEQQREHQQPVVPAVETKTVETVAVEAIPYANRRIRRAMDGLLWMLNHHRDDDDRVLPIKNLGRNLTSSTFSSSWWDGDDDDDDDDDDDRCSGTSTGTGDCAVTLNYLPAIPDPDGWREEAVGVCRALHLSQLTGRSRKRVTRATGGARGQEGQQDEEGQESSSPSSPAAVLRDCLLLSRRRVREREEEEDDSSGCWAVDLIAPNERSKILVEEHRTKEGTPAIIQVPVLYEKREFAFFHPNAGVMRRALKWLLDRVSDIASSGRRPTDKPKPKPALLELYSGCGAHTVALWKADLLSSVTAVEMDDRLVRSFQRNCEVNGIPVLVTTAAAAAAEEPFEEKEEPQQQRQPVRIVSGDARVYAKTITKKGNLRGRDEHRGRDDAAAADRILLVDPPKCGIGASVRQMALSAEGFHHILYISCGRDALVDDLKVLCGDENHGDSNGEGGSFEVVDVMLLDLFPGTSAVETLVHLQRRE